MEMVIIVNSWVCFGLYVNKILIVSKTLESFRFNKCIKRFFSFYPAMYADLALRYASALLVSNAVDFVLNYCLTLELIYVFLFVTAKLCDSQAAYLIIFLNPRIVSCRFMICLISCVCPCYQFFCYYIYCRSLCVL